MRVAFDICKEVAKNAAMAVAPVRQWRTAHARTSTRFAEEVADRYAFGCLDSILPVVGSVAGLHVVEIGPGDHLASGLAILAAGAASYTAIDRFPGDYDGEVAQEWYRGVETLWPRRFAKLRWPEYLDASRFPGAYRDRVRVLPTSIESVDHGNSRSRVGLCDIICSFHVGEHVSDIEAFARLTAEVLAPNGVAIHFVNFRPHQYGGLYPDTLAFLRLPDWLWYLMGSARGTPNRRRFHELVAAFESAGLSVEADVIERLPENQIDRRALARRFRDMPVDSLAVMQATFVCRPMQSRVLSLGSDELKRQEIDGTDSEGGLI
jgi:SAM-dependent methyltransferase